MAWHGCRCIGASQYPLIKAKFDGDPEKLAFFLNQVWSHLDQYGEFYTDDEACVSAIGENLEGEAVEWVTLLHDEGAPELGVPTHSWPNLEPSLVTPHRLGEQKPTFEM